MVESKRAERRRRTRRVAMRRWNRRQRESRLAQGYLNLYCEPLEGPPTLIYAKTYRRHRCAKRRHGRPKVGRGVCHMGLRVAGYARILSRRLARDLTAGRIDGDEVLPTRGFFGFAVRLRRVRVRPPPEERLPSEARTQ